MSGRIIFPVVTCLVNGIPRRTLGGQTSCGFGTAFATARVAFDSSEQSAQPGDQITIRLGYVSTGTQLVFVGEADDDTLDYWPQAPGVSAAGFLSRTQRGIGKEDAGAPRDANGDLPAYYATAVDDASIVAAVCALYGVPTGDIERDTPAATFGNIEPVTLGKTTPGWQLIQELDRLTFMRTFDGPDGLATRLPTNSKPAAPTMTLTQGVHLLPGSNRGRSRRPIINRVNMKGLPDAGGPGVTPSAERYADAPSVNGRPLIPDPPKYQGEEWQSNLAETEELCDRYAARRVDQMNRLAETISVKIDRCRPDIRPGMSLGIASSVLGYTTGYIMWVQQVDHVWDATSAYTTLGLIVATAAGGINPNLAPVPVIHLTIEVEYADGAKIWLVRADGRDSYDPDGVATDLDPQHGITTYLWSGTPNAPVTPVALPQATYVYTSDPTGAQICLTVGDTQLKLATACVTITAPMVAQAVIRDLWAAVTSDLLLSTDGGGTWVGTGVAAVGCCEEAHPEYQLAWTAGGDLWKVALSADGLSFTATLVLSGKGITAANISLGLDGTGTHRCWAAGASRKVYESADDGVSWAEVGAFLARAGSSDLSHALLESPFAAGDLSAISGDSIQHSFDGGRSWTLLKAYPDPALTATRLTSGHFADASIERSYRFASFAGTSSNVISRILEADNQEDIDFPAPARPATPTGLTLGLATPAMYVTDATGTGKTWRLDTVTGGGNLVQKAWNVSYGLPQHLIRDGAIDALLFGAALAAIWKSYDGLETVVRLLALVSPRIGKMVGFGRLRHAPTPTGDLYASAMRCPGGVNQTAVGLTTTKIIRLTGTTWSAVSDHPIPVSEHTALLQGTGRCNFGACTAATQAVSDYQFVRPLLRAPDGAFYTFCVPIQPDALISVTPGYQNLYKSADNCATWTRLTAVAGVCSLDVATDGALWAVTDNGQKVRRSTDGGTTWADVLAAKPSTTDAVAFHLAVGALSYLDRWQAVACSPSNAGRATVSCYAGLAQIVGLAYASAVKNFLEAGFTGAAWGLVRTPVDDATVADRRASPGYTTFRIPDGTADTSVGGPYSVLGQTAVPDSGAGLSDDVLAYRRIGGRTVLLGRSNTPDNALHGATYVSTDDGRSWAILLGIADTGALAAAVCPASRDAGYDATTDTLYLGLALPTGSSTSVAFVKRIGSGAWVDLTGSMAAALGDIYSVHPRGMVVGVPS